MEDVLGLVKRGFLEDGEQEGAVDVFVGNKGLSGNEFMKHVPKRRFCTQRYTRLC